MYMLKLEIRERILQELVSKPIGESANSIAKSCHINRVTVNRHLVLLLKQNAVFCNPVHKRLNLWSLRKEFIKQGGSLNESTC